MGFGRSASGSGMVMMLALAGIGIGIVGWGLAGNACSIQNGKCSYYSHNWLNSMRKTSGVNAQSLGMTANTIYCSGVTTSTFSLVNATDGTFITSQWVGWSRNVTNALITVYLKYSTNAPSTVFGSGACAAGTIVNTDGCVFPVATAVNSGQDCTFAVASTVSFVNDYFWLDLQFIGSAGTGVLINNQGLASAINVQEQSHLA